MARNKEPARKTGQAGTQHTHAYTPVSSPHGFTSRMMLDLAITAGSERENTMHNNCQHSYFKSTYFSFSFLHTPLPSSSSAAHVLPNGSDHTQQCQIYKDYNQEMS